MNLSKLIFSLLCLWFVSSFSARANGDGCCITITTGVCTSVGSGGPPNFLAGNLNWGSCGVLNYDYRMGSCGYAYPATNGGFTFGAIDTATGTIMSSYGNDTCNFGQFGNYDCIGSSNPQYGFDFSIVGNHPTDMSDTVYSGMPWPQVISRFLDSIPDGYVFFMYAVSEPPYSALWAQDSDLVNKMAAMGATDLPLLCDSNSTGHLSSAPYIFWTVKGNPSWGGQKVGSTYDSSLTAVFCYGSSTNQVSDISPTAEINIYPNPSSGSFILSSPVSYIGSPISIFDCLGRTVMTTDITKENENIDMGNLPAGIYTLIIGQSSLKMALVK